MAVTLDVYVCNFGADHSTKAKALMAALLQLFAPATVAQNSLQRGINHTGFDTRKPSHE
jgi:S-adenosylmethionine decarboxylase